MAKNTLKMTNEAGDYVWRQIELVEHGKLRQLRTLEEA